MCLVHSGTGRLGWSGMLKLVSLFSGRVPESSIICRRDIKILGYVFDPRREAINTFARREGKRDLVQLVICILKMAFDNLPLTWNCVG